MYLKGDASLCLQAEIMLTLFNCILCACVRSCEFLADTIVPYVKTAIVLHGFVPEKKVIELAHQCISLK
jgi:hypothetical protein